MGIWIYRHRIQHLIFGLEVDIELQMGFEPGRVYFRLGPIWNWANLDRANLDPGPGLGDPRTQDPSDPGTRDPGEPGTWELKPGTQVDTRIWGFGGVLLKINMLLYT